MKSIDLNMHALSRPRNVRVFAAAKTKKVGRAQNEQPQLLSRVEELRLLSQIEQSGLLSRLEKQGVTLSGIEKAGLLSKAENLGLLSRASDPSTPKLLTFLSILAFGAACGAIYLIPNDSVGEEVEKAILAGTLFATALATFFGSNFISSLQRD